MNWLVLLCFLAFSLRRLLTYLHIFQQEEYDSPRFLRWLIRTRAFDRRASLTLLILAIAQAVLSHLRVGSILVNILIVALAAVALLLFAFIENDPRKTGKKRLVLTPRARGICIGALIVTLIYAIPAALVPSLFVWILCIQLLPFSLILSALILQPGEDRTQRRFWEEAHSKLLKLAPTTIGITGSYGKTSVKHILGHILDTQAPTLITPGSVNTVMGIARIVREQLGPHHRFFVCEMGAYGIGSIQRLCELAPPQMAVITAIGAAHYERFKSLDTVAHAKFELAEAALRANGKVIVAEDVLRLEYPQQFAAQHVQSMVLVGPGPSNALQITSVRQTREGLSVDITWKSAAYTLNAPLYGPHHAANLALAFAAAAQLGVDPTQIVLALRSLPQINHRLEVKPQPSGAVVIDDAYNSNPVGFAGALEILSLLGKEGGKRILVTPGMVELGAVHDEEHARLGTIAARHADVLLPVLPERIPTFIAAFKVGNPTGIILPFQTFTEAQAWLTKNLGPRDVVLIENDLPDLYEKKLAL